MFLTLILVQLFIVGRAYMQLQAVKPSLDTQTTGRLAQAKFQDPTNKQDVHTFAELRSFSHPHPLEPITSISSQVRKPSALAYLSPYTMKQNSSIMTDPSPPQLHAAAITNGDYNFVSLQACAPLCQGTETCGDCCESQTQSYLKQTNEQDNADMTLEPEELLKLFQDSFSPARSAPNFSDESEFSSKRDADAYDIDPTLSKQTKVDFYTSAPYLKPGKHGLGGDFKDDEMRATGEGHQVEPGDAKLRGEYSRFVSDFRHKYSRKQYLPGRNMVWTLWEVVPEQEKAEELWLMNFGHKYAGRLGIQWPCGCEILGYHEEGESEED